MNDGTNGIVGLWVYISNDDHYKTGYVRAAVGDFHWLVRMQSFGNSGLSVTELVCIDQLHESFYFDSEEELNKWIEWLDKPDDSKPRVVSIGKKKE
jgi:hypothetical protein